jgi:hypothetical protein
MAEVFGIVAGSLSVAVLFNNAVDCFEYIQLGRSLERIIKASFKLVWWNHMVMPGGHVIAALS